MRTAILALMLVLSFGCSRDARLERAQAAREQVQAEQAEAERVGEQKREARERKKPEKYREDQRVRDLASAKEAVVKFRGSKDDWTNVVKGGPSGPSAELCSQVEALLDLHSDVFERIDTQSAERLSISWQELGVVRADLWKEFQTSSKKAAATLFAVYKRPNAERQVGCGRGEGSWRLDDPGDVMNRLFWVMGRAKLSPVDIGTTAEAMRTVLVSDYKAYIVRYRGMIARGEASRSDGGGTINAAVYDAEQLWGIPQAQLGLTAEERQMIR